MESSPEGTQLFFVLTTVNSQARLQIASRGDQRERLEYSTAKMSPESNRTETSPLLGAQRNGHAPHYSTVAIPNSGLNGPPYDESAEHADHTHATEEEQAKGTLDARSQLKFIIPAVSLGV